MDYKPKLTDPLSLNRYNYVKSSAPNYTDPSGHNAVAVIEKGVEIAGVAAVADGPLPYGDVIAGGILIGTAAYAGYVYLSDRMNQAEEAGKAEGCIADTGKGEMGASSSSPNNNKKKKDDGRSKNNQKQNEQTNKAAKETKLSKKGQELLHKEVKDLNTGDYQKILDLAREIAELGGSYVQK